MMNRLFIALEIPGDILDKIILIRDSIYGNDPKIKWEPKDKLHITLKFLGDTDSGLINNLISCIAGVIEKYEGMELEFSKFGMFYRDKNPSILWLGLNKNVALKELFLELENSISSLGFKKENREFRPHLTILRIKGKENLAKLNKIVEEPDLALKFRGKKIILFKSTLNSSGSVYEEIENFILK